MAEAESNGLDSLREQFPAWEFEARWLTAGTGPDRKVLLAHHGDVTVSAWTAAQLAAEIGRQA